MRHFRTPRTNTRTKEERNLHSGIRENLKGRHGPRADRNGETTKKKEKKRENKKREKKDSSTCLHKYIYESKQSPLLWLIEWGPKKKKKKKRLPRREKKKTLNGTNAQQKRRTKKKNDLRKRLEKPRKKGAIPAAGVAITTIAPRLALRPLHSSFPRCPNFVFFFCRFFLLTNIIFRVYFSRRQEQKMTGTRTAPETKTKGVC